MADEKIGLQVEANFGNLRKELKAATQEVYRLQNQFGELSPEVVQAAKKVAELRDKVGDTNQLINSLSPDAKFKAFGNAVQGVAGGFAALQGAVGLFGDKSKEVEAQLLKVQSALAFSQGINQVLEAKDSFKQFAVVLKDQVVGAFKNVRTALASIGIGLLIAAVGLLIANWERIKKVITDTFPALKGLESNFGRIKEVVFGVGNAIKEFLLAPIEALIKLVGGDFKGALKSLQEGVNFTKNFQKGAENERLDQQKEAAKKRLEAQIDAQEKEIAVQKATGAETYKLERDNLLRKQKLYVDDKEKLAEINQEIRVLDASHQKQLADQQKAAAEKKKQQDEQNAEKRKAIAQAEFDAQQKLQKELLLLRSTAKQKELIELQYWYDEQKKVIEKNNGDLTNLNILRLAKEEEINVRYRQAQAEEEKKKQQAQQEMWDQQAKALADNQERSAMQQRDAITALVDYEAWSANEKRAKLDETEKSINEDTKLTNEQRNELLQALSKARIDIDEKEFAAKQNNLSLISGLINAAGAFAAQGTAKSKALAVAATTIETYASASGAYRSQLTIPSPDAPIRAAIAAATAVLGGLARVKSILAVKIPNATGSTGSVPSIPGNASSPIAPAAPVPVTTLDQGSINNIGNRAFRAYVVESDITNQQDRANRIARAAALGG